MTRPANPINKTIEELFARGNLSTEAISGKLGIDRDYVARTIRLFRVHAERDVANDPCDGKHIEQVLEAHPEGFPDIPSIAKQRVRA